MDREELDELKGLITKMGEAFNVLEITNVCIEPDFDAIDSLSQQILKIGYFNPAPSLGDLGMGRLQFARKHYLAKALKGDEQAFVALKKQVKEAVNALLKLL